MSIQFTTETKKALREEVVNIMEDELFDVVSKRAFNWQTFFESIDGFAKTSGVSIGASSDEIEVLTDGTLNNEQEISKVASWQGLSSLFDKSLFRSTFNLNSVADVTAYITVGDVQSGSQGYGFKVVNSSLKGVVHNGSAEATVDLKTITTDTYNIQANFLPGEKVVFLVDGVERGVLTSGLPTGLSAGVPAVNSTIMHVYVKATAAAVKLLQTSVFSYWQFRARKSAT